MSVSPAWEPDQARQRSGLGQAGGSLVAIVTPFRDRKLDGDALATLCERQIRRGSTGIVVCGSTGEAAALSSSEHGRVVAVAAEAAAGRVPVIAGCGALSTERSVRLAIIAACNGAAALLCAPPPYSRPTQDGIMAHVRAVAHAAGTDVLLYDVPGRTGVAIEDTTVEQLAQAGLIVGIKDAGGDLARPPRLRAHCGEAFLQLAGDDATAAAHRAMGGHGCISVTANVVPALCAAMHAAWVRRDMAGFGRVRDLLAPLHQALFAESNPIPVKAALALADLCAGDVRLPLTRATAATIDRLAAMLPALMAAEEEAAGRPLIQLVT